MQTTATGIGEAGQRSAGSANEIYIDVLGSMSDPASILRALIAGYGPDRRVCEPQGDGPVGELLIDQEAVEASNKTWLGRSTVRTLGCGPALQP